MVKIRVIRSYWNDKEGNSPTGTVRDVTEGRAAALVKRQLAVVIDAPKGKGKRGAAPTGKTARKTAGKTAPKNGTGSRTGGNKPSSSSPQGQAPATTISPGTAAPATGDGKDSAS